MPGLTDDERVAKTMDKLSVNFGVEILTLVKGYVSTEVDARLSFDTEATLERAHNIIALYAAAGETREQCFREVTQGVGDVELGLLFFRSVSVSVICCCGRRRQHRQQSDDGCYWHGSWGTMGATSGFH